MMTPFKIRRPDYVVFDTFGQITDLYCKICGTVIGNTRDIAQGRVFDDSTKSWIEQRTRKFQRTADYAEMKILFNDGSSHVTNLCRRCASTNIELDVLKLIYNADMDMEEKQGNKHTDRLRKREPLQVTAIRNDGGGLI